MLELITTYTLWPYYLEHWLWYGLPVYALTVGWVLKAVNASDRWYWVALVFSTMVLITAGNKYYWPEHYDGEAMALCWTVVGIALVILGSGAFDKELVMRRHWRGKWIDSMAVGPYWCKFHYADPALRAISAKLTTVRSDTDWYVKSYRDAMGHRYVLHPYGSLGDSTTDGYVLDERNVIQRLLGADLFTYKIAHPAYLGGNENMILYNCDYYTYDSGAVPKLFLPLVKAIEQIKDQYMKFRITKLPDRDHVDLNSSIMENWVIFEMPLVHALKHKDNEKYLEVYNELNKLFGLKSLNGNIKCIATRDWIGVFIRSDGIGYWMDMGWNFSALPSIRFDQRGKFKFAPNNLM